MVPTNPTTAFVTSGPYRFTRNPMYLGMVFLYIAVALALGVIWALVVLPVVIAIVDGYVISTEECYLEMKYGDEYRAYKQRTRRWL
jgi:protein-S-isoprenylcysteine O-methyltransferase Ste14